MFSIKGTGYKDFVEEYNLELIFLNKGNNYIENDYDIVCDEIKILKNIGIAYYLKGVLVKFIKAINIYISYDNTDYLFKISYNNNNIYHKESDTTTYIRYKNAMKTNKNNKENYKEQNNDVKLGTLVLPNNIILPFKNSKYKRSAANLLSDFIFHKINNKEDDKFQHLSLDDTINFFFDNFGYKVVDKTDMVLDNSYVFVLELDIDELTIETHNLEENLLIKETFCRAVDFNTKENYYELIENLKECLKE